ncbi:MAG: hypothetical protein ACRD0X_03560 [Thermoanaerobaculia bacterium]
MSAPPGCCPRSLEIPRVACSVSPSPAAEVPWQTVAALARPPVPPRQRFWLCHDPECPIVYFGELGTRLERGDLTVDPGFKTGGSDLVCYCFAVTARDADAASFRFVRERVAAGECACEVKNPSGKCCLAELQAAVAQRRETQAQR